MQVGGHGRCVCASVGARHCPEHSLLVGVFCGAAQAVMAVAAAPMAGLAGRHGDDDFGQAGKKAGPVEALGRADTAAGWRRGGKPPERPPAGVPPPQPDVAAAWRVPERGASCRCGQTHRRRQLRGRTGQLGGVSRRNRKCWHPTPFPTKETRAKTTQEELQHVEILNFWIQPCAVPTISSTTL